MNSWKDSFQIVVGSFYQRKFPFIFLFKIIPLPVTCTASCISIAGATGDLGVVYALCRYSPSPILCRFFTASWPACQAINEYSSGQVKYDFIEWNARVRGARGGERERVKWLIIPGSRCCTIIYSDLVRAVNGKLVEWGKRVLLMVRFLINSRSNGRINWLTGWKSFLSMVILRKIYQKIFGRWNKFFSW